MAGSQEQRRFDDSRKTGWNFFSIEFLIPFLFLATIVVAFMIMMAQSISGPEYIKYTTVTGFFQQDDTITDPSTFDYTTTNFGLIDRAYDTDAEYDPDHKKTQWQRFENKVARLNSEGGGKTQYKVLYMGRHGEGYHNVAEAFYGTKAWDCYWSLKDGNGSITWDDAHLTPAGVAQAEKANIFWRSQISKQGIPTAESYYTSPLTRCLQTAYTTFDGLDLPQSHPFIPEIKELFREVIGVHTCDRRSSKTYIYENYPTWHFEDGFKEKDPLWSPDVRESDEAQDIRSKEVLDDVFTNDKNTYLSITSHSGEIGSILRVLEHRKFGLGTGQVIPVLVKAETVEGSAPTMPSAPYIKVSTCTAPPASSAL